MEEWATFLDGTESAGPALTSRVNLEGLLAFKDRAPVNFGVPSPHLRRRAGAGYSSPRDLSQNHI